MLSRLQSKLGTAGLVVAIVALVAALTGAAYAANAALSSKQKKEVTKIAKQYAGKPGAPGAPGTAGAPGAKGDKGDKGDSGTNGTNGKNVQIGTPTGAECAAGGATVQVEGVPATKKAVCNGKDGEDGGFSEEMESGTTLRGVWTIGQGSEEFYASTDINWLMEYPGGGTPTLVYAVENDCSALTGPELEACEDENEAKELNCPGTPEAPEAKPGFLCIYVYAPLTPEFKFNQGNSAINLTPWGDSLVFQAKGPEPIPLVFGRWALTAA